MLEIPAAIVSQQSHLQGPSHLPVSQELKTSGHGSVRVIPAWKAPGNGCVRVNSIKVDEGPPKPVTSITASDDDTDLIAKEADAGAKAQLAAEADEEWRIWTITNPEAYAQARAGAAMAIWHQQWSPQVVPATDHEVKMVDVMPKEVEVRMQSTGQLEMAQVGTIPEQMAEEKQQREETNRRYRRRYD
ncbi:hypothetical protein RUND412_002699 [Rhizina undulata]